VGADGRRGLGAPRGRAGNSESPKVPLSLAKRKKGGEGKGLRKEANWRGKRQNVKFTPQLLGKKKPVPLEKKKKKKVGNEGGAKDGSA